jgi:trans-aconitate 2-methyltransferase
MRETARSGPWAAALAHAARSRDTLHPPAAYYDRLIGAASQVEIWHTHYQHPMADGAAIVEWFKGSGLRPFLDPLVERERAAYLADYRARISAAHTPRADGRVLLRFPRLFIVAVRR